MNHERKVKISPFFKKLIVFSKRLQKGKSWQGVWFFWHARMCFQHQWLSFQPQPKNAYRFKPCGTLSSFLYAIVQWLLVIWMKATKYRAKKDISCKSVNFERVGWPRALHLFGCLTAWVALHSSTAELPVCVLCIAWPIRPQLNDTQIIGLQG